MVTLPTLQAFRDSFTKWFNTLVGRPPQFQDNMPDPQRVTAPDLTFAEIQALLGNSASAVYYAKLVQAGTADPTVTIIYNSLGLVNWTRNTTGIFFGISPNLYTANKTVAFVQQGTFTPGTDAMGIVPISINNVTLTRTVFNPATPAFDAADVFTAYVAILVFP